MHVVCFVTRVVVHNKYRLEKLCMEKSYHQIQAINCFIQDEVNFFLRNNYHFYEANSTEVVLLKYGCSI